MTDPDGSPLNLQPAAPVVPATLEVTACGLLNSAEVARVATGDNLPTGNVFNSLAKLEVEARLDNGVTHPTSGTAYGGSATAWYLFAGPADLPVIVGFLNGTERPIVETFGMSSDPDTLGLKFRAHFRTWAR